MTESDAGGGRAKEPKSRKCVEVINIYQDCIISDISVIKLIFTKFSNLKRRNMATDAAPPPTPAREMDRFMGRVYLPPAPSQDLHVNIGYPYEGKQLFPSWMPVFEHAISKKDYDEMVGKMKALLAEKCITECDLSMRTLSVLFCLGVGCLFFKIKQDGITNSLKSIAAEYGVDIILVGAMGCRMIYNNQDVNAIGIDQYGIPLSTLSEKRNRQVPAWAPPGYNIILKGSPELDLRSSWPRSAGALAMLGFSVPSDCKVIVDDSLSTHSSLSLFLSFSLSLSLCLPLGQLNNIFHSVPLTSRSLTHSHLLLFNLSLTPKHPRQAPQALAAPMTKQTIDDDPFQKLEQLKVPLPILNPIPSNPTP